MLFCIGIFVTGFGIFDIPTGRLLGNGMPLLRVGRLSTILVEFGTVVVVELLVLFGNSGGRFTELRRFGFRGGIRGGCPGSVCALFTDFVRVVMFAFELCVESFFGGVTFFIWVLDGGRICSLAC